MVSQPQKGTRLSRDKNATPGDGAREATTCLDDVRPTAFTLDRSTAACTDPDVMRTGALQRYGDLRVTTGSEFIRQWHSKYYSQVMPFVILRMVAGPDFYPQERWRRPADAPIVTSDEFTRGFAHRIDSPCRNDWSAVPIVQKVHTKFKAEHTMAAVAPIQAQRGAQGATRANELVADL